MEKIISVAVMFVLLLFTKDSMASDQFKNLVKCNVIWDSPSQNLSGSMPLGNGDIGMNVWVEENGDLLFFISKTDSWSDDGCLL